VDYRRFLQQPEQRLAPVVGGHAWLTDRRVRVEGGTWEGDGWWRVQVQGRTARPIAAATAEAIAGATARLPRTRGHVLRTRQGLALVDGQAGCQPVDLPPAGDEPPLLAPLTARRWPIGDLLLWDQLEWEGEVEETARRALEDRTGLAAVKGAPSSLRAAFAYSAVEAASRAQDIAAQPGEVKRWVGEIADAGHARAELALRALAAERQLWANRQRTIQYRIQHRPWPAAPAVDLETEVEETLRAADARYLGLRRLGGGTVEVRWMFQGQRLISLVAEQGLGVIDSGLCLSGEDALLTLDSLPGVVRQAMDDDVLVITSHD
jgi:hypothetical protein